MPLKLGCFASMLSIGCWLWSAAPMDEAEKSAGRPKSQACTQDMTH